MARHGGAAKPALRSFRPRRLVAMAWFMWDVTTVISMPSMPRRDSPHGDLKLVAVFVPRLAVANGDFIYVGCDNGRLYAVSAQGGKNVWEVETGGPIRSSPAISEGVVYVGSEDGHLYAIGESST